MTQLEVDPAALQIPDHGGKAFKLPGCEGPILRPAGVRHGKMGEDPLWQQMLHGGNLPQLLRGLFVVIGEEAQPGHSGVQLQVDFQPFSRPRQGLIQLPGIFQRVNLLSDAHIHHILGIEGRSIAQNQNWKTDIAPPELHRLLHIGDRQIVRSQIHQLTTDGHGPVSVGVRLDNPEKAAVGGNPAPQQMIVVAEIVHGNISPGSLE